MKEIRKETILLNNGIEQEVIVWNKKHIVMAKKDKIYVNEDFFKILTKKQREAIIYHERGHITKIGRHFITASNIFITLGALFIAIYLSLAILNCILPTLNNNIAFLIIGLWFLAIWCLLRWLLETICDANSAKNVDRKFLKSGINKAYSNRKIGFFQRMVNDHLLHVPKKIRFKIIDSFD